MNLFFPAQSPTGEAANPSGHWLLQTGRAVTVLSKGGGQLRIARGQVWATLGSAHDNHYPWHAAPLEPCAVVKDYFLSAGDALVVPPGARVVLESTGRKQDLPVAFDWDYVLPSAKARRASRAEVAQATGELGAALGDVRRALRRLIGALVSPPKQARGLEACL